jgi:hypothetical protein
MIGPASLGCIGRINLQGIAVVLNGVVIIADSSVARAAENLVVSEDDAGDDFGLRVGAHVELSTYPHSAIIVLRSYVTFGLHRRLCSTVS